MIKKYKYLLFIAINFFTISSSIAQKDYEELDSIIAIVENDVITKKEFDTSLYEALKKTGKVNLKDKELSKKTLDVLIEKKIINQYAEANGINIDSSLIENAIKNIALNNNISTKELKKSAAAEGALDGLYDEIRFQLILRSIKERAIFSQINISEYEINKFLEKEAVANPDQYNIFHILIKHKDSNKKNTEKIAEIQSLLKTQPFAQIAKKYSDGPFSENGGDMGWAGLNNFPDLFVDKVKNLSINEISAPFESENGVHIILLEGIKASGQEKVYSSQYNINQILLKNSQIISEDDVIKKINNIKNQIKDGLSFGDAASQYSEDATSSLNNGALGWVDRNNLLPEFQIELDKGKPNTIIGPFKTSAGWHLIELIEKREKDITNESKKLAARMQILNYKAAIRYKDWFETLKQESNIEILLEI